MQSSDVRAHNLAAALRVIVEGEGTSRAELAHLTGLTKPTATALVEELIRGGLVEEGVPAPPRGAGRPATPLQVHRAGPLGVGLELAADHISCLVVDLALTGVVSRREFGEFTGARVADAASALASLAISTLGPRAARLAGVCVSVPGRVAAETHVVAAPNLLWRDVPLGEHLGAVLEAAQLPAPALLANDAKLAAGTELRHRRGETFLFVHAGTGIGGAISIDGQLVRGDNGWAGEIGHVVVENQGLPCRCGGTDCLEAHIGYHALRESAGLTESVHIEDIVTALAARAGQREAVLNRIGTLLGRALAGAVNLVDAGTIVLSGYLAPIIDELAPAVLDQLERSALARDGRGFRLEAARGQVPAGQEAPSASLAGAAAAALSSVLEDPSAWLTAR